MSGSGAAKVLSSLHSFRGREDELARLLSLTEALRAHGAQEAGEGTRLSAEEGAVLGALRNRLSRLAGEERRRLERALLKVELLRRHLQERSGEPPASAGNERRELMIRKLQASYLAKSETARQEAREAVLASSSKAGEPADTESSEERQERARGLVQRASVIALAGYLADVESSQPSGVLNALRDEVSGHVKATLRIENALRTLDGMTPSAAAAAPEAPPEPAAESAPAPKPRAPEARKNRTQQPTRPRGKKTASPGAAPGARDAGGGDAEAASQEAASPAVEAPTQAPRSPRKRERRGAAK